MINNIERFLTDPKYKDRWIMINLPNASSYKGVGRNAFSGKFIKGFLSDDKFSNSYSMNTGDENISVATDLLDKVGEVGDKASTATARLFGDLLTYSGSSNTGMSFNFTVIPEVGGNMSPVELEEFLSKLINPEPYTYSFKALGGNTYSSYISEFNTLNRVVSTASEFISSDKEKDKALSEGLVHIHIGDNVHLKGMVITDNGSSATMLRDEDGQFYGYEINITAAPYKLLDAEQAYKQFTNSNSWELR